MHPITAADFLHWKDNPVTKYVYNIMRELRKEELERIEDGAILSNAERVVIETSLAVGRVQGIDLLLDMEVKD